MAFRAPAAGSYVVTLEYPRDRGISVVALIAFVLGSRILARRVAERPGTAKAVPYIPHPERL